MSVAETLAEARKLIAQGWTQGAFYDDEDGSGCYCLAGAVGAAEAASVKLTKGRVNFVFYSRSKSIAALSACLGGRGSGAGAVDLVTEWNDTPGRTQQDVLALIDRAIAKEAKS
jgi:hypothetical protein